MCLDDLNVFMQVWALEMVIRRSAEWPFAK